MAASTRIVLAKTISSARQRNFKLLLATLATAPLAGFLAQPVNAALVYWDPTNGSATGTGSTTPVGTWDTSTSEWNPLADGTGTPAIWNNANGDTAVFSAGTDSTGTYAITVGAPITVAGITREEGQPVISAAAGLVTLANNALTIDAGVPSGTQNLTVNIVFDNAPANVITKTDTALLFLNTSQTAYIGKWVSQGGTISVTGDDRFGVVPANPVADQITLDGGNIRANGTLNLSFNVNRGITLGAMGGGFDSPNTATATWNGAITGTLGGPLKIAGAGAVVLTNTANNYDGITSFTAAGTLILGASEVIPNTSAVNMTAAATLNMNGFDETIKALSSTVSTGQVLLGSNTLTLDNPTGESAGTKLVSGATGTGKVVKNGTGMQILNGTSSGFSGEFVLNNGTIGVGQANCMGIGKLTINGGALSNTNTASRIATLTSEDVNADFSVTDTAIANPGTLGLGGAMTLKVANPTITVTPAGTILALSANIGDGGNQYGFTKAGAGQITLSGTNTYTGPTTVSGGTLFLNTNSTTSSSITVTGGSLRLGQLGTRIIQTGPVSVTGGKIELFDNKLATTTSAGTPDPITGIYTAGSVQGMVQSGRNGGSWDGSGIVTSQTAAHGSAALTTLAVATAGDVGFGGTKTFGGQTVNSTDTLVMYTYAGDTNLDGQINGDDYFRIDQGYTGALTGYENGDLNYDGRIDADDYFIIDSNYGNQTLGVFPSAAPLGELAGGVSAVPEPASMMLLALSTGGLMRRRRRR